MKSNKMLVLVVGVLMVALLATTGCARKSSKVAGGANALQKIHFDFDKYNIKSEYEGAMKSNGQWLQNNKNASLVIEGHCDSRGTAEYNIALGDRRAKAAKNYLQNLGVDTKRMSTISYGKERPICTTQDEACWAQNRRDEFVAKQ